VEEVLAWTGRETHFRIVTLLGPMGRNTVEET